MTFHFAFKKNKTIIWDGQTWSNSVYPETRTTVSFEWASQVALVVKNRLPMPEMYETWGFDPWVRKISWKRAWWPTPVFLPGEPHPVGRGLWWAAVHGVVKSQTWRNWIHLARTAGPLSREKDFKYLFWHQSLRTEVFGNQQGLHLEKRILQLQLPAEPQRAAPVLTSGGRWHRVWLNVPYFYWC